MSKSTEAADMARLDEMAFDHFGAGISAEGDEVTLATLKSNTAAYTGKTVRLRGVVTSVCKKKGCWLRVSDGGDEVFVKFVDYGFFMPLECETREAVLEGTFSFKETSVAELKHYLEDEGKHAEAAEITEPQLQMSLLAAGVALKKK